MPQTPQPTLAADLLRNARWMVGLTQAEVAARAGLTRQVISSYESRVRAPSVGTLERMLAGCGLRLRLSVVPEPGLEDAPTLELLARAPLDRLDFPFQDALIDIARAVTQPGLVVVTGKSAARMRGACVRVLELELWAPWSQPIEHVRAWLADASITEPYPFAAADLREGVRLIHGFGQGTDVVVRRAAQFDGYLSRSTPLDIRSPDEPERLLINLADPDDCCVGWHPRDRDHLAVQRAVRLSAREPTVR